MYRLRTFLFVPAFLTVIFHHGDSARILAAIPMPSYSHQIIYQRLWRELALRGHEVVVMTTDPTGENITRLREIDMSSTYEISRPLIKNIIDADHMTAHNIFTDLCYQTAQHELALPEVRQLIDDPSEHFDLVIVEFVYPQFFALAYRFKAPFIGVTSFDGWNKAHSQMGNLAHSVLFPHCLLASQVNLSFKERLISFVFENLLQLKNIRLAKQINELNSRFFGKDYPDYYELAKSVDMLFVNNNPLFSPVRPLSPSTISIAGGLHMSDPKDLPKDLQEFLDAPPKGVVYFSMGTNVRSFPTKTLTILMETFAQLPYNILWKYEDDRLPGIPKNVKIMKWVPQQDVLRHQNIKLFVTQGGMQSLEEALFAHVPLIVIPHLGDQAGNAAKVVNKGVALQLDHKTLTIEELKKAIFEVIKNPKYKNNMKTLANQIGDQPMTALERAVWWIEYIIRHKSGQHLKGPIIPLYQYFYLDIWAFLIGCLLAALAILYSLYLRLSSLCNSIFGKSTIKFKKL